MLFVVIFLRFFLSVFLCVFLVISRQSCFSLSVMSWTSAVDREQMEGKVQECEFFSVFSSVFLFFRFFSVFKASQDAQEVMLVSQSVSDG